MFLGAMLGLLRGGGEVKGCGELPSILGRGSSSLQPCLVDQRITTCLSTDSLTHCFLWCCLSWSASTEWSRDMILSRQVCL